MLSCKCIEKLNLYDVQKRKEKIYITYTIYACKTCINTGKK